MKQRINITIDLETASLCSDAAILSIAAQVFDPMAKVTDEKEAVRVFPPHTANPSPTFEATVNATSCITAGLHFEMGTIKWWSERSPEAKAALLATPTLLSTALEGLANWLDLLRSHFDGDLKIWCQGTDFDIPILANAYRACGLPLPWRHTDVRDARTYVLEHLEDLFGPEEKPYDRIPAMPDGEEWVHHSALSDARRTAWNVAYVNSLLYEKLERVDKVVIKGSDIEKVSIIPNREKPIAKRR